MTFKLAQTADGFASGGPHDPRLHITGRAANLRVQIMRATHEAIMVGVGTVLGDDPALTVRLPGIERKPWRVVLDTHLRLPPHSRLATGASDLPTLVIAGKEGPARPEARLANSASSSRGSASTRKAMSSGRGACLLSARGVTRVFCEGGPGVAPGSSPPALPTRSMFTAEAVRPSRLPGAEPRCARCARDAGRYRLVQTSVYGTDILRVWERL